MLATGAILGLLAALSPETEVAQPRYGLNPTSHFGAAAAVNQAGQYLVAYDDRRGDDSGWSNGDNLRLVRVAAGGALLDPGGIEPALSGPERQSFAVASDGQDYLVAWSETADVDQSDLRILVLGHDGTMLLPPTTLRSAAKTEHFTPSVCFDGAEYRMAFVAEDRTTYDFSIYGARLTPAGAVVGAPALLPTAASSYARYPQVGCASGGSAVVWLESTAAGSSSVRGVSWSPAGVVGTPADVSRAGVMAVQSLAIAAGAGGFLAVWEEARADTTSYALVGQLLSSAGARTSASDLALDAAAAVQRTPQLGFDGTAWRLVTRQTVSNQDQTFVTTINASGAVSAAASALTSGPGANRPSGLACGGAQCFALWSGTTTNVDYAIGATRLGATNTPLDAPALAVSTPSDEQSQARLAWDGTQLLVTWASAQGHDAPQLLARRLDSAGAWIDAAPLTVASGLSNTHLVAAALPSGGWAIVYGQPNATQTYNNDYSVAFVSPTGAITSGPAPLVKQSNAYVSSLSCIGNECVITIDDFSALSALRFDHSGAVVGAPATFQCANPFVVGQERWCVTKPANDATGLELRRYDTTLTELGQVLPIPTPNETLSQGVALIADANGVTLAWDTTYTDPTTMAISVHMKAARVDLAAQTILAAPVDLFTSVNNGWLMPQAILDGGGARWLVWYANDGLGFFYKLRVQELSPSLALAGSVDELTECGLELVGTSALSTTNGNVAFAYLKRDSAPDRGSHRVELRLSTGAPPTFDGGTNLDGGQADGGHPMQLDGGAQSGDGADAGQYGHDPQGQDASGCGCRLAGRAPFAAAPALLVALGALLILCRRRSRIF